MTSKLRLYNIELLRIFSIFLIVCLHFTSFAIVLQDYDFANPNRFVLWIVRGVGYTGTNLFILISAFFLCKSTFKVKSLLLLWAQVFFYSLAMYFLSIAFGLCEFKVKDFGRSLFPILFTKYWFVTCYAGLYILFPFLNKLFGVLNKKTHAVLIVVELLFFSVVPNLFYTSYWMGCNNSSSVVWFCVLFTIGAYIRNYVDIQILTKNKVRLYLITSIFILLPLLSKIVIALITSGLCGVVTGSSIFYNKSSILLVPLSVSLFLTFLTFDIKSQKAGSIINVMASSVFSVYLISENPNIKDFLWTKASSFVDISSITCSFYAIALPFVIFVLCVLLDQVRKLIFLAVSKTGVPQKICDCLSAKINPLFQI